MAVQRIQSENDGTLPTLVRQLASDSKHLVSDEVRFAKLSVAEGAHAASRGLAKISAAFGIAVIAATAATALLALLVGEVTGRIWAGALIVGAAEVVVGMIFYRRGRATLTFDK